MRRVALLRHRRSGYRLRSALTRKFHNLVWGARAPRVLFGALRLKLAPAAFTTLSVVLTPKPSARRRRQHAGARVLPKTCETPGLAGRQENSARFWTAPVLWPFRYCRKRQKRQRTAALQGATAIELRNLEQQATVAFLPLFPSEGGRGSGRGGPSLLTFPSPRSCLTGRDHLELRSRVAPLELERRLSSRRKSGRLESRPSGSWAGRKALVGSRSLNSMAVLQGAGAQNLRSWSQ